MEPGSVPVPSLSTGSRYRRPETNTGNPRGQGFPVFACAGPVSAVAAAGSRVVAVLALASGAGVASAAVLAPVLPAVVARLLVLPAVVARLLVLPAVVARLLMVPAVVTGLVLAATVVPTPVVRRDHRGRLSRAGRRGTVAVRRERDACRRHRRQTHRADQHLR